MVWYLWYSFNSTILTCLEVKKNKTTDSLYHKCIISIMTTGVCQLALISLTWPFFWDVGTGGSQTGDIKVRAKSQRVQIHRHRIGGKKKKSIPTYPVFIWHPLQIKVLHQITSHLPTCRSQKHMGDVCIPQNRKNTMLRTHEFHLQRIKHVKISLIRDNAGCLPSRWKTQFECECWRCSYTFMNSVFPLKEGAIFWYERQWPVSWGAR